MPAHQIYVSLGRLSLFWPMLSGSLLIRARLKAHPLLIPICGMRSYYVCVTAEMSQKKREFLCRLILPKSYRKFGRSLYYAKLYEIDIILTYNNAKFVPE
jgi:hypothetical protein